MSPAPVARLVVLAAAFLLALEPPSAQAKDKDAGGAEEKARAEAGAEVASFALWCGQNGAKTAGTAALDEARALDARAAGVAEAEKALEALSDDAAGAAEKADAQRKAVGPKVAKAYDKLAALDLPDAAAARAARYEAGALGWEPTKGRVARLSRAVEEAFKGKPHTAALLLQRLRRADPEAGAKHEKTELDLALKGGLLMGHPDHPLLAWVSLPKGWQKGKTYPVLVGVEGAGCSFRGYFQGSTAARGSRAAIVVTPCGLTNTNELKPETYFWYDPSVLAEFNGRRLDSDGPGQEKVLEVVRARFGGEEKVFLTGFSGGGKYCYWKLFTDPARVRGAAPACANFGGDGASGAPAPGDGGGPTVLLMTGEKDQHRDHVFGQKPGIEGQTDNAENRLKELGYAKVRRVMVKGAGHSPLHAEVWRFVDEVLGAR